MTTTELVRVTAAMSLSALSFLACSDDDTGTSPDNDPPPQMQAHDCVPYQPTEASDALSDSWSVPNERDTIVFALPNDPGGGYVSVTLTAQNAEVEPWMNLDVAPSGGTVISSGAAVPGEQTITDVFEVAAGKSIEAVVLPWINAPAHEYPVNYTLSWTFTSRVDCYEPNNAAPNDWPAPVSVAKAIPIGEAIQATSIVGHDENGPPSGSALFDWYKFTVTSTRTLNVRTLSVPSDVQVGLRVFAEDGGAFAAAPIPPTPGETTETGAIEFPPGTWYVEFFPSDRGQSHARTSSGEEIPPHFTGTYQLMISG